MNALELAGKISGYRQTIDNYDAAIIHVLAERFRCTAEIGRLKAEFGLLPRDEAREAVQHARTSRIAEDAGLDQAFTGRLMQMIRDEVVRRHCELSSRTHGK